MLHGTWLQQPNCCSHRQIKYHVQASRHKMNYLNNREVVFLDSEVLFSDRAGSDS